MTPEEAVDKVRKLLALAKSDNASEAANAAAAAQRIAERYAIDAAMLAEAQREAESAGAPAADVSEPIGHWTRHASQHSYTRMPGWHWELAWNLATSLRCRPWSCSVAQRQGINLNAEWKRWFAMPQGDARDRAREMMRGLEERCVGFVGRERDAATAAYMLDSLTDTIDRLASEYTRRLKGDRNAKRRAGKSFRRGCVYEIGQRLASETRKLREEMRRELRGDVTALARLDTALLKLAEIDASVDAWMVDHKMKYSSAGGGATTHDESAHAAGRAAGRTVSLSTGGGRALKGGA